MPSSTSATASLSASEQRVRDRLTGASQTQAVPRTTASTDPARQALSNDLYKAIMWSLRSPKHPHDSDAVTDAYRAAIGASASSAQILAASTLLINVQGGVAKSLETWVDTFNQAFANGTSQPLHDHATLGGLRVSRDAARPPVVEMSRDGVEITVPIMLYLTDDQCPKCLSNEVGRFDSILDVSLKLTREEAKRIWSTSSDRGAYSWWAAAKTEPVMRTETGALEEVREYLRTWASAAEPLAAEDPLVVVPGGVESASAGSGELGGLEYGPA